MRFAILFLFLSLVVNAQSVPDFISVEKAETDLRTHWKRKYHGEKILSVVSAGDTVTLEKVDAKGKVVERKLKIPFSVLTEKSGNQREYEAGANYLQKGKKWVFSEIGIGEVKTIASEEDKAPNKSEVKELVLKAFHQKYSDYTWSKVLIDDGTFGKGNKGIFYRYEGDINRTDVDEKSIQCRDIEFMLIKETSGSWKVEITSQGKCY